MVEDILRFRLKSVYTIGVLDFVFDEDNYYHEVKLMDVRKRGL